MCLEDKRLPNDIVTRLNNPLSETHSSEVDANVETLLKQELIFGNPVVKCGLSTWLATGLCECLIVTTESGMVGYFRKEHLKDEKGGIKENQYMIFFLLLCELSNQ